MKRLVLITTLLICFAYGHAQAQLFPSPKDYIPRVVVIPWTMAFADSIAANDSLTVYHVRTGSVFGDGGSLFVKNTTGVSETVKIVLDYTMPNRKGILDSLQCNIWTESTTGADRISVSVFDDSLYTAFKSVRTAGVDSVRSASARTAKQFGTGLINIYGGGVFRTEVTIVSVADSLWIGPLRAFFTNP